LTKRKSLFGNSEINGLLYNKKESMLYNKKMKRHPRGNKDTVGNKGGTPKDNENAKGNRGGNGGSLGKNKAVRAGDHESIWWDTLDEDEQELLGDIDTDSVRQADGISMLHCFQHAHITDVDIEGTLSRKAERLAGMNTWQTGCVCGSCYVMASLGSFDLVNLSSFGIT
jgi:hypothetical protein